MRSVVARGAIAATAVAAVMVGTARPSAGAGPAGDPLYSRQWNLAKVGAPTAWGRSTGQGVLIGVVDTGVDLRQEDLAGKVVAGTDCVGSGGNPSLCAGSPQDDNGHGTHVAGIAAADTDNGIGIAGMAPAAGIVAAKVLNSDGSGNASDVAAGVEWVVQHGARVVNLSIGSDLPELSGITGNSLSPALEYAWQHGAVPVVAAGNSNTLGLGGANYGNTDAIVVGASGPSDEVAPYSSPLSGAKWGLVAPGGDGRDASGQPSCDGSAGAGCIVSTYWTASNAVSSYALLQGTSMAAPMVSGTVALLLAEGMTPIQAVQAVLATADRIPCGGGCAGRLDAARAVESAPAPGSSSQASSAAPPVQATGDAPAPPRPSGSRLAPPPAAPPPRAAGGVLQASPPPAPPAAMPMPADPAPTLVSASGPSMPADTLARPSPPTHHASGALAWTAVGLLLVVAGALASRVGGPATDVYRRRSTVTTRP